MLWPDIWRAFRNSFGAQSWLRNDAPVKEAKTNGWSHAPAGAGWSESISLGRSSPVSNIVIAMMAAYAGNSFAAAAPPELVSYSEFLSELRAGHLSEVQIGEQDLTGVRKSDATHRQPESESTIKATRLPGVGESLLFKELEAHPVKFSGGGLAGEECSPSPEGCNRVLWRFSLRATVAQPTGLQRR